VKRVLSRLTGRKQTLLFSATTSDAVEQLSKSLLRDPVLVAVTPAAKTADRVEQRLHHVARDEKRAFLARLLADPAMERCVVFTRTKHGANRVAESLVRVGIRAEAIHGNKSQNARERALDGFRRGTVRVLVATDIAARGIDVPEVSHVVNFDLPTEPETYVHRIGRTARAGAAGVAISLCGPDERDQLRDIEKLIKQRIPVAA
jgi:ATP-dependent RNA helicase RhlE